MQRTRKEYRLSFVGPYADREPDQVRTPSAHYGSNMSQSSRRWRSKARRQRRCFSCSHQRHERKVHPQKPSTAIAAPLMPELDLQSDKIASLGQEHPPAYYAAAAEEVIFSNPAGQCGPTLPPNLYEDKSEVQDELELATAPKDINHLISIRIWFNLNEDEDLKPGQERLEFSGGTRRS
ncbi:hypothetical protein Scep_009906 [Stephania cephalantha]|uniref:Uncharacterized protein n=1 Tax=Stephania cephalantha TaxID=152367 RepID=A0AAP0JV28_9MAGN